MQDEHERISNQIEELKRAIGRRGEERMFYTRMIYLITVLSFVLASVGLYMKTNAEILEKVDRRIAEAKGYYMPLGDGRRLEEKIEANTERSERILNAVDRIKSGIADLAGDVKLIRSQVERMMNERGGDG